MDDKVYKPEEIVESPFPGELASPDTSSKPTEVGVVSPTVEKTKKFPVKRTAVELLSTALNTRSKKILQEFELTQSGGIKIGDFQEGLTGDIRITPNGLTARNKSGITTLAVDGDTGDAVFKGNVRASTFTNDFFIVDAEGNVVANSIILSTFTYLQAGSGGYQTFTSSTEADVTSSTLTFTLERSTLFLISVDIIAVLVQGGAGDFHGNGLIRLRIDSSEKQRVVMSGGEVGGDSDGAAVLLPGSTSYLISLSAGTHTIKLTGACDQSTGTTHFSLYRFGLSYVSIGNTE